MVLAHVSRLDLNLLLVLDALLREGSVTGAAKTLGLTQPAVSRALGRLREALGDALFVRSGRTVVPTPFALALQDSLHQGLEQLDATLAPRLPFDPKTARRTFHVSTADYGMAVVVPALMERLSRDAPRVDVVVHPQAVDHDEALVNGDLDVVIGPKRQSSQGVVWTRLLTDDFVCLVRRSHRALTLASFCEAPHVFVAPAGQTSSVVDEALERRGLSRRIALRVPSFLVAPIVVAQCALIATLARRIAVPAAEVYGLRVVEPPLALPSLTVSIGWHERMRHDDGHQWFRRLLVEVAGSFAR